MRMRLTVALTATLCLLGPSASRADLTLSLSATDLTTPATSDAQGNITVNTGDTVQIGVTLSGLAPGETLDTLTASLSLPDNYLTSAATPTPGSIVPDPTEFTGGYNPATGVYDVTLQVLGNGTEIPIVSNGSFFTFDVTASAPTQVPDVVSMTFASAFDGPFPGPQVFPNYSSTLSVTINQPNGIPAAPEPSTLVLGLTGAAAGLASALRKRRRS